MERQCREENIILLRMCSSYCFLLMVLLSFCTHTEAYIVGGKQNLHHDDNNLVPSSQLSKLFERTSNSKSRQSTVKSVNASGKTSHIHEQPTTTTVIPPEPYTGDSTLSKRKASKGGNWWSQIETTDAPAVVQQERKIKNIKAKDHVHENSYNHDKSHHHIHEEVSKVYNHNNNEVQNSTKQQTTTKTDKSTQEDKPKKLNKSMAAINNLGNQWSSIKQKQRTITTVSMQELKNLDAKLIKTYRQCQKRRLYFFGGMLYRTRDFVVKLYKDAKSERKILESMGKQVDSTRKKLMVDNNVHLSDLSIEAIPEDNSSGHQQQQTKNNTSGDSDDVKTISTNRDNNGDYKSINKRQISSSGVAIKQESTYIYSKTSIATSIVQNDEYLPLVKSPPSKTTKELPKLKNIYINDAKLRRQLDHAQSLIDRIHRSSSELSSIVDDIIFVFRLDGYRNRDKTSPESASDKKSRRKSSFKSPIKVFMERYGNIFQAPKKQDLRNTSSSVNSNGRVSQQLMEKDFINNGSDALSLWALDPLDMSPVSNRTAINNNSTGPLMSQPLTLHPSYNIDPTIDTNDSVNITSTLDDDIGFGESSTILTLYEGSNSSFAVYHLDTTTSRQH